MLFQGPELQRNQDIVERVCASLTKAGMFGVLGDVYEATAQHQRALEAYKKANAFNKAVDVCRAVFPNEVRIDVMEQSAEICLLNALCMHSSKVVPLEEAWGDFLVSQKQLDASINHYIEAGCNVKAIEASIQARQW
jgi:intraflagellar transport protein 172